MRGRVLIRSQNTTPDPGTYKEARMAPDIIPPFPDIPGVEFRHIPDFPGYAGSDDGRIWSAKRHRPWRQLKARIVGTRTRYGSVALYAKGHASNFLIQRLVLSLFVGPCPDGMEACHADGNSMNNVLSNVRWDTPQHNRDDMHRHGTDSEGSRNSQAKIDETIAYSIRTRRLAGARIRVLCADYHLSCSQVKRILTYKNWHSPYR